jgi:thioredoxin
MSDHELENIRLKKTEILMQTYLLPNEIITIHNAEELDSLWAKYKKIIIVDFWAVWCGPCRVFSPVFERLQEEYKDEFIFAKVNVDEAPDIANKYMISGVPTTLILKNGQILNKIVGATSYNNIKMFFEKLKDFNH